jgi:hypothetical protein
MRLQLRSAGYSRRPEIALTTTSDGGSTRRTLRQVSAKGIRPAFTPGIAINLQGMIGVSYYSANELYAANTDTDPYPPGLGGLLVHELERWRSAPWPFSTSWRPFRLPRWLRCRTATSSGITKGWRLLSPHLLLISKAYAEYEGSMSHVPHHQRAGPYCRRASPAEPTTGPARQAETTKPLQLAHVYGRLGELPRP